jgi:hypothetical protein
VLSRERERKEEEAGRRGKERGREEREEGREEIKGHSSLEVNASISYCRTLCYLLKVLSKPQIKPPHQLQYSLTITHRHATKKPSTTIILGQVSYFMPFSNANTRAISFTDFYTPEATPFNVKMVRKQ